MNDPEPGKIVSIKNYPMVQSPEEHLLQVTKLFYSVAIGDGNLHDSEAEALTQAIIAYEDLVFSKYSTEKSVKIPRYKELLARAGQEVDNSLDAFTGFKNFYTLHQQEFSREQKDLILRWSNKIASAYAKQNKSELVILVKTSLLFNPI